MLLPFLLNLETQARTWRENGISIEMVLKRNAPVADISPELYGWMEKRAKDALEEGWLFRAGRRERTWLTRPRSHAHEADANPTLTR